MPRERPGIEKGNRNESRCVWDVWDVCLGTERNIILLQKKTPKRHRDWKLLWRGNPLPKKAHWTRWLRHKEAALKSILHIVIASLPIFKTQVVIWDVTFKVKTKAKKKGWLGKMGELKLPLMMNFYVDTMTYTHLLEDSGSSCLLHKTTSRP